MITERENMMFLTTLTQDVNVNSFLRIYSQLSDVDVFYLTT